jgi:hypothetical protein
MTMLNYLIALRGTRNGLVQVASAEYFVFPFPSEDQNHQCSCSTSFNTYVKNTIPGISKIEPSQASGSHVLRREDERSRCCYTIAAEASTLYSHEHIPLLFPTRFFSGTDATHSHHSKAYASWSSWTSHCRECISNACQSPMDSIRRDCQEIW